MPIYVPPRQQLSLFAGFIVSLVAAMPVSAAVLEEVIVTAQVRAQSLQDVPVSVSAMSGEKMMEAGIGRIEDLQAYVPNFTMSESGIGTDIFIRGIGSGENQGFEQSVGMYVDGIYYGRAQLARAPFLDLARVEILRGPQNILYGKNSIAGAISIITADPGEDNEGMTQVTYDPEVGEKIVDFMTTGPINDTMAYRFAMRWRNIDGHIANPVRNKDEPERKEYTLRGKLSWDIRDDITAKLKVEHGSFDVSGRHLELIGDLVSDSATPFFTGRTYGEILNDTRFPEGGSEAGIGTLPGPTAGAAGQFNVNEDGSYLNLNAHPSVLDHTPDYSGGNNGNISENNTYNITLNVDYYVNDHTFTFITGLMAYDYDEVCDCDFTAADLFTVDFIEDYKQFSQEFRWVSPVGDNFEFIGGGYIQYHELNFFDSILVDTDFIPELVNAADLTEGGTRGDNDPDPNGSDFFERAGYGDAGNSLRNFRSPRDFTTDVLIGSAFLQGTWTITDTLRLTLGGRFTAENKEGSRELNYTRADGTPIPFGEADTAASVSFAAERHSLKGKRKERQFAPLLNLQWDYSDAGMMYFTASKGFKSGGYDARSNQSPGLETRPGCATDPNCRQVGLDGSFEFDNEEAVSFELGTKSSFFEGVAELNVAIYHTNFDNLQVSVFDGTLGFNVGNAAAAVARGVELDGRMALSENWILAGGLAYLDFEFEDHPFGTCVQREAPTNPNGINCDYSGKPNQYSSPWSGNLILAYENDFADNFMVRASLDMIFTDDYNPSPNLDDRVEQDGYIKWNGRIAVSDISGVWEVALVGKNLTDELIIAYAQDTPSANTISGAVVHHGFIDPPRTVSLQGLYRW